MYKVYVHGPFPGAYRVWAATKGWTRAFRPVDADLIIFTGGEDISPELYNQPLHTKTSFNKFRDERDKKMFDFALGRSIPMIGICRGGQFLNVMCGGSMVQHVTHHTNAHDVFWLGSLEETVTKEDDGFLYKNIVSTHHQMMLPGSDGTVMAVADVSSSFLKYDPEKKSFTEVNDILKLDYDHWKIPFEPEVIMYETQGCLCFQPHPEMDILGETDELFDDVFETFEQHMIELLFLPS